MRQRYLFIALSVVMIVSASVIIARCRSINERPSEQFIMLEEEEEESKSMYDDLPIFPETKTFTSACYSKK